MKPERVEFRLTLVPEWEAEIEERVGRLVKQPKIKDIRRSFQFSCFPEAMAFIDTVADRAWEADVDISIYVHGQYVALRLPGDGSGLTEAHFDLAEAIDDLVA